MISPDFFRKLLLRLSTYGRCLTKALPVAVLLAVTAYSPASADTNSPLPASGAPDALVLVLSQIGSQDMVSIQYSKPVPEADVKKDIAELRRLTNWQIQGESIRTVSANTPASKRNTSVSFTTQRIVDTAQGELPIEPFIIALRRLSNIRINYLIAPQFKHRGLKNFDDRYVNIRMRRTGNSYLYDIHIKDNGFERLGLPYGQQPQSTSGGMPTSARVLLIIGLAIFGGGLAYLVAAFTQRRRREIR